MFLALGASRTTTEHISSFCKKKEKKKRDGFKPVFISHSGAQRTTTSAPMSICLVDKKSYRVDAGTQASAKCDFKVGHVNERE